MKKSKLSKIVTFIVVAIFLIVVLLFFGYRSDHGWICSICASSKSKTVWRLGITTSAKYEESPLEKWMIENNIEHEHDWRKFKEWTTSFLLFSITESYFGNTPPIFSFPFGLIMEYIHSASEEDIKSLVEVLKSGDEEAQEAKFEEIADLLLD